MLPWSNIMLIQYSVCLALPKDPKLRHEHQWGHRQPWPLSRFIWKKIFLFTIHIDVFLFNSNTVHPWPCWIKLRESENCHCSVKVHTHGSQKLPNLKSPLLELGNKNSKVVLGHYCTTCFCPSKIVAHSMFSGQVQKT